MPVPVPMPEQGEEQTHAQVQAQAQAHQTQGHGHDQGPVSASAPFRVAVPRVPDGMKPPAAGEDEAKAAGVLSTPTTPVPSIENENDKWPREPVSASVSASASASAVPKRPTGPSLLTQQLAEARGISIPVTGQPFDALLPVSRLQQPLYDLPIGSRSRPDTLIQGGDTKLLQLIDDSDIHDESDGDFLTPKASPRAVAMATAAAVSTLSLSPRVPDTILSRTLDTSEIGDVEPRPRRHREYLRPSGRGMSLERPDKERRFKELAFPSRTYSDTSVPPTMIATMNSERESGKMSGKMDSTSTNEQRSTTRPRNPDHRVSLGPEKAWSIGSEDLNNAQDGLVEKSIAEVLAGVEPNARSRKASHSLRFFKEGLPEEKSKTRDSRPGPKEKLSVTDDVLHTVRGDQVKSLQPSPSTVGEFPGRLARTRTFPLPSTDTFYDDDEQLDYFKLRPGDKDHRVTPNSFEDGTHTPKSPGNRDSATLKQVEEGQEVTSDAAVEDGELSGEEKISSAVFVPHKGPKDSAERPTTPEVGFDVPIKQHQRNDDGSSWLVKADEPEADDPGTPDGQAADQPRDAAHSQVETRSLTNAEEEPAHEEPVQSISTELNLAQQKESQASHLASPSYGDHVHDQQGPSQPLDAIELVPYRHQVGGHTTLWRFSKRAVCKQLNNRENEFYEQIEKHHRDLLPFLPRYVPICSGRRRKKTDSSRRFITLMTSQVHRRTQRYVFQAASPKVYTSKGDRA